VRRVNDPRLLDWLEEQAADGDAATGYDLRGWEANTWILHAMYETEHVPDGITYDDLDRADRAANPLPPTLIGAADLGAVLDATTDTGVPLGRSASPGRGWRRLLWIELAERLQIDPFSRNMWPGIRSFPFTSWPANIRPPAEGSLDRDQFLVLLDHLDASTLGGSRAACLAFYAGCAVGDYEQLVIYEGTLERLIDLYDDDELPGAPSNIWPEGRLWFVYTDADTWATRVSGSDELIGALLADPRLETVTLEL
jgi:hypothetical protein